MSLCFTPSLGFPFASGHKTDQHLSSCIHPFAKLPANLLVRSSSLDELKQRARPQITQPHVKAKVHQRVKTPLCVDVMDSVHKVLDGLQVLA